MIFDFVKKSDVLITDRVQEIISDFDIKLEHSNECFAGNIDIEKQKWNIGLIVGGSGTGKTTIAKEIFGDKYIKYFEYTAKSVIDDMPEKCSTKEIELAFTSVGFSSPPSWLKPYNVLSTGEKMRVDLARAILSENEMIVFDEFTSVVDREVAKTCSIAIQKEIRHRKAKFVAISCHKDIIDYLNPDWVYDTDQKSFFGQRGAMPSPKEKLAYTELVDLISNKYGEYLGSITI